MELNIGNNIRRLRIANGYTQERLAEQLNVSTAAVSKWESKHAYPDITMLCPIANLFKISVDELLNYNTIAYEAEIKKIIAEYKNLNKSGRFREASLLISNARKKFPEDHLVMHTYMWDKAGGSAGNSADILLENYDEFTRICNCIIQECQDEMLRLEAINMRAKLLHARGDTEAALSCLSQIPSWWACSEQKKEQLFAKNTDEYLYYNKMNCYNLTEAAAMKMARIYLFDDAINIDGKIVKIESEGDKFLELSETPSGEIHSVFSQTLYGELASFLTANGEMKDIIRIREKQFKAMECMTSFSKKDAVFEEYILRSFGTNNIIEWQANWLLNYQHGDYEKLRNDKEYMNMLSKWKNKC